MRVTQVRFPDRRLGLLLAFDPVGPLPPAWATCPMTAAAWGRCSTCAPGSRIEGNWAARPQAGAHRRRGPASVTPTSSTTPAQPLAVDIDGDGFCDAVNPAARPHHHAAPAVQGDPGGAAGAADPHRGRPTSPPIPRSLWTLAEPVCRDLGNGQMPPPLCAGARPSRSVTGYPTATGPRARHLGDRAHRRRLVHRQPVRRARQPDRRRLGLHRRGRHRQGRQHQRVAPPAGLHRSHGPAAHAAAGSARCRPPAPVRRPTAPAATTGRRTHSFRAPARADASRPDPSAVIPRLTIRASGRPGYSNFSQLKLAI